MDYFESPKICSSWVYDLACIDMKQIHKILDIVQVTISLISTPHIPYFCLIMSFGSNYPIKPYTLFT